MRNWSDVLPDSVARKQHAFERGQMAWRMKRLGFSNAEIGKKLGCGATRTYSLLWRGEDEFGHPSPVERYFLPSGDIAALAAA